MTNAITKMRRSRLGPVLVTLFGAALVIAAMCVAIIEGYASDAELRGGNIVPAIMVGLVGLVCAVIGVLAFVKRTRE